jgi:coproporphyrinogen III oxidase-like Fe-S oxidoreductase
MKKILLPHQFYYPALDAVKDRATPEKMAEFKKALQEGAKRKGIIYLHVPFCNSECSFCGFDRSYDLKELGKYLSALKAEIDFYSSMPYVQGLDITGIHIGGGTPTLLPAEVLSELIKYSKSQFNAQSVPLNVEGSACTLDDIVIGMLKDNGVSRVSMGVQTFNPELRKQLNIKSTLNETIKAIAKLKQAGIVTYIDLMHSFPNFGIADQSRISGADVKRAIDLGVDGMDFSQFFPFHNPLELRVKQEGLVFPSSEEVAETILNATAILENAGFKQTSEYGFCKQGDIMLEKAYFGDSDCVAIGPSSLGILNGFKYRNKRHTGFINSGGIGPMSLKKLSTDELNRIPIIGFPKVLTLDKRLLTPELKEKFADRLQRLIDSGMLEETPDSFDLTLKGKCFISNLYFMMMDKNEQEEVEKQLKILKLE